MPTKIETDLSPEQLFEFFKRCAETKGGGTGPRIQALASEFGVTISHESANNFRKGALREYLDELKSTAAMAESVAALAKNGVGLSDGAASAFAAKVFDAARKVTVEEIGGKKANNVSLAISRLRSGDQRATYLQTKLAEIQQGMQLREFDAVAAAIKHAKEIRTVLADKKLDDGEKTQRVRKILFGDRPADFQPVTTTGAAFVDPKEGA